MVTIMVEPMMFFGIGFLLAALCVLIVAPLVHFRAVRLTMRRLEASIPLTMAEVQADKDLSRAEFAMSTGRLERDIEQIKTKSASQLAELGRKGDQINRLKIELGVLRDRLLTGEEELRIKSAAVQEAERALSAKESELSKQMRELSERSMFADAQKVEVIALKTEVEGLKKQLGAGRDELEMLQDRHDAIVDEANRALSEKELVLAERIGELEGRSVLADVQKTEIITLKIQIEALKQQLGEAANEMKVIQERREAAIHEGRRALSEKGSELTERMRELGKLSALEEAQKEEIITLKAEVAALKRELNGPSNELSALTDRGDAVRTALKAISQKLIEERTRYERFQGGVTELAQQLMTQRTEDKSLSPCAKELENHLIEQSHLLKASELSVKNLRGEIAAAHKTEAELRSELEGHVNAATQALKAEKAKLQAAIDRATASVCRSSSVI